MRDGVTTKDHTVRDLSVTEVDPVTDIVRGTAAPFSDLDCGAGDDVGFGVQADGNGQWVADFSGVYDIVPGTEISTLQQDEDFDAAGAGWDWPQPLAFEVHRSPWGSGVYFTSWTVGATLTLTIDDPTTRESPDYETTVSAEEYQWPDDGFGVGVDHDVRSGHVVTVTDGTTTRNHTVTDVAVTSVDAAEDVVQGTAGPLTEVLVYYIHGDLGGSSSTFAAGDGTWMVDTSAAFDIVPGTIGGAEQFDEDGVSTVYDWEVPRTLAELLDEMVADGALPNAGVAKAIMKLAQRPSLVPLTNCLSGLVRGHVTSQQTMNEILVMVAG